MFRAVLIANRGEIARRVIRTANWMGIRTIAVYSEIDRDAVHVREAGESYAIGGYLDIGEIVSAAKSAGAEAVHPGYGFLAENADFARACADAGITFIGPSPAAIRDMGDKAAAKAIMEKAGVPVVPGYHGKKQDKATLLKAAESIGFPVMLKPSAGGGGKGMRIVRAAGEFAEALASAKREAKSAFGDDRMLVEKYIERPRHIEVQVFGDSHGTIVHLFERDCSIQRRHQKVIEEAPAPGVGGQWRDRVCTAAVAAAKAVEYVGAGTVEFIVGRGPKGEPGDFWFMEMNTRLQVEHPVTEMITGTDLVEWQFRVAAGEALPLTQDAITVSGHAVEARLYAEDPARDFLPAPGTVRYFDEPGGADLRVDSGIDGGGTVIPPDYDPLIAKVICRGDTRAAAISGLREAMGGIKLVGVATNAVFLSQILDHAEFRAGAVDTGFIERNIAALAPPPEPAPDPVLALACVALLFQRRELALAAALESSDPWSPWARADGWRLNDTGLTVLRFVEDGGEIDIACHFVGDGYRLDLPGGPVTATLGEAASTREEPPPQPLPRERERGSVGATSKKEALSRGAGEGWEGVGAPPVLVNEDMGVELNGASVTATIVHVADALHVFHEGGHWRLGIHNPLAAAELHEGAGGRLTAPMPGKVAAVLIEAGEAVAAGQALIVVEAMKMEHTIHAPSDGTVTEVRFKVGDQVSEGEVLLGFEETD